MHDTYMCEPNRIHQVRPNTFRRVIFSRGICKVNFGILQLPFQAGHKQAKIEGGWGKKKSDPADAA